MLRRLAWIPLGLLLAAPLAAQEPPPPPDGESFQVVVNAENPTTELPANKIAKMFLKKLKRWDHGIRVQPIDLDAASSVRKEFTRVVHGKSVTAIKSFWQRMIFSGRDVPPAERRAEQEILDFVRATPGAIGYVGAGSPLGDGVKKLDVGP